MKEPSVRKNYIYNTIYQVLNLIIPFITAPYTARIFGAGGIGIQSYTSSVLSYFTMIAALGTAAYGQREIAMHRKDKKTSSSLFWEIELLSVITTGICLCIWILLICMGGEYKIYYLVMSLNLIAVAFDITWFFGGHEQYRLIVIRNSIIRLIGLLVLFVFVRKKEDLLLYIGLLAATGLAGNLSLWFCLPRFLVHVKIRTLQVKRHWKQTLVYFIPTIATSVYTILDKTMIGIFMDNTYENGYYEQATKIVRMAQTLILSLNTVMSARMSYLFAENRMDDIKKKLNQSLDYILFLGIPMAAGLAGIAPGFVTWFLGNGYDPVIPVLRWFSITIVIIGISNCLGMQYLTPSGQRSRSSKAIIAGAVINLVLNLFLIPHYGAMGAVAGSVAAETVITICYLYMSREFLSVKGLIWLSCKRIAAALVMLIAVEQWNDLELWPVAVTFMQVAGGVFLYLLLLLMMKDPFVKSFLFAIKNKMTAILHRHHERR